MLETNGRTSPTVIAKIANFAMNVEFDMTNIEFLVRVTLQLLGEDLDAGPTMSYVVDKLLHQESEEC